MKSKKSLLFICISMISYACTEADEGEKLFTALPDGVQAVSLLGDTVYTPQPSAEAKSRYQSNLAEAQATLQSNPQDANALIWSGRWTAYMGTYRDAIKIYTEGIEKFPKDARMYRHRGHRYISIREITRAIADFEQASKLIAGKEDVIEPDGLPNSRNIPVSSLHTNIWYHLGLGYYLMNDMERALDTYEECLNASQNPDMVVASAYWMYMILRRLNMPEEAKQVLEQINADMDVIENTAYFNLLLFFKGEMSMESLVGGSLDSLENATMAYGVGNWHYFNGNVDEAKRILRQILGGNQKFSFGYIAAEADMSRMQ